ncbi:8189_t:CDS:2, partial [Racocetra persica]
MIKEEKQIEAQNFIDQQNIEVKNKLNVWTDGYCKRNSLSDAIGEIYAVIRALEICDKKENLIINTDSNYIIISRDVKKPQTNFDLVNRFNDLIKEREGKTYLKHVKEHSGIYGNEQADRLAYLGSKKPDVELILPELLAQDDDIIVGVKLPKLYTWDFKTGQYKMILNKNGKITNNYKDVVGVLLTIPKNQKSCSICKKDNVRMLGFNKHTHIEIGRYKRKQEDKQNRKLTKKQGKRKEVKCSICGKCGFNK